MCNCIKETVYFSKVKPDGQIPIKRDEDGCYDVYACFEEGEIEIQPGQVVLIPTGIASACSKKYRFGLRERGSTGTRCMSYRAGQIDSGYRGEWFVPINNTGNRIIIISKYFDKPVDVVVGGRSITYYPYTKAIVSVALEEVPEVEIKEIPYEVLLTMTSERGESCLGQSGK